MSVRTGERRRGFAQAAFAGLRRLAVGAVALALLVGVFSSLPLDIYRLLVPPTWQGRAPNPLLARAVEAPPAGDGAAGLSVRNHVLFNGEMPVDLAPSPNLSRGNRPRYVILHYTVSGGADGVIRWMSRPQARVSAHLVVDRAGRLTQLLPFDYQAWHAGKSAWRGERAFNNKSIGIELVNWGPLRRGAEGIWATARGFEIPADQVVITEHDADVGWQRYSEAQIGRLVDALRALDAAFEIEAVLGHDDIAPGRKMDPGPAFPWEDLRARLAGPRP